MEQQHTHDDFRERMMMVMNPTIPQTSSFCNDIQIPQSFTCLDQSVFPSENSCSAFMELNAPQDSTFSYPIGEFNPFLDAAFCESVNFQPLQVTQEEYQAIMGNGHTVFDENPKRQFDDCLGGFKVGITGAAGLYGEKSCRSKKPDGQPSKNLMAERRRRKRLNDRLSMLRSIVPKISKMDRTSILGDTIDYMRELHDKIIKLREEGIDNNSKQMNLTSINSKEQVLVNEVLARSPPKFQVNRENHEIHIKVCCPPKPGLLLSTLSTLDSLGLDVEQCVISCFNDFSFHASCSEVAGTESLISCEDIKQALFINAGCGGRNI